MMDNYELSYERRGYVCCTSSTILSKGFPNHIVLPVGRKK